MYGNLIAEMKTHKISQRTLAAALGIHANSAWRKLNGITDFTVNELVQIHRQFFPEYTLDYLSKQTSEKER